MEASSRNPAPVPTERLGEEGRRIMTRVKQEADGILEKARAILREAKSVQGSLNRSYEDRRAEARRIGFGEGFRVGKARGEARARTDVVLAGIGKDSPEAVAILEEVALRLKEERDHFETEKQQYVEALRRLLERAASSDEGLADSLVEFLSEHPPSVTSKPVAEVGTKRLRRKEGVPT